MESTVIAAGVVTVAAQRAEETRKKMKVMVAIDESDGSFYALHWVLDNLFPYVHGTAPEAATEAAVAEAAMVTLVHVQQPLHPFIFPAGPGPVYTPSGVVDSLRKAQQANSAALLSRALQMCKDKQMMKAESLIVDGDPKEMICQAAEEMHVDLLVVGSRGLSKIKKAFLGSVSDYCAHHAKCALLIVKPPPKDAK